jgi:hypothetical protein
MRFLSVRNPDAARIAWRRSKYLILGEEAAVIEIAIIRLQSTGDNDFKGKCPP